MMWSALVYRIEELQKNSKYTNGAIKWYLTKAKVDSTMNITQPTQALKTYVNF